MLKKPKTHHKHQSREAAQESSLPPFLKWVITLISARLCLVLGRVEKLIERNLKREMTNLKSQIKFMGPTIFVEKKKRGFEYNM